MIKFDSYDSEVERLSEVPSDVRTFTRAFLNFVEIRGICDPFYIANCSAMFWGRGDGMGNFGIYTPHDNPRKATVDCLVSAYWTCAQKSGYSYSDYVALLDALQDVFDKSFRGLCCNCCGNRDLGRQWWNRDNGFGVCADCSNCADYDSPSMAGIRGIHFDLEHYSK